MSGVDLAGEPIDNPRHRRRLARSTAIVSAATGASRILGLIREIVAAGYFGAAGPINAFTVAYAVPNLVRALVADTALSAAFVPVFSELLERGERARAWRVASSLLFIFLLGLSALTALFILLAPFVMRPFGYEGAQEDLVVGLSRVLFPTVALLGVSGVVVGVLNSYEQFTIPAITPVFWNLAIIAALVVGVPFTDSVTTELYIYAGGIVLGTVIQVLLPLPWLYRLDGRLGLLIDWKDPAVKRVFKLMLPVTLGIGLINFNLLVDTLLAARLLDPQLAPRAIDLAFRLYMLPQGMFSVALATVLFPALSRLAARGDTEGFRDTVSLGLRQVGFLLVPASMIGAVLAEPIVRLLYQRGEFAPDQTPVVAGALAAFMLGLTFNGTMLMLNRAFFSLQQAWVPTAVALGNLFVNGLLDWGFSSFGTWGIPLATSVVNIVGTIVLLRILGRRVGRIEDGRLVRSFLPIVAASLVAAGAAYGIWRGLDTAVGRSAGAQVASVGLALVAAICAYLVAASVLRVRELEAVLTLAGRLGRRSGGRRRA